MAGIPVDSASTARFTALLPASCRLSHLSEAQKASKPHWVGGSDGPRAVPCSDLRSRLVAQKGMQKTGTRTPRPRLQQELSKSSGSRAVSSARPCARGASSGLGFVDPPQVTFFSRADQFCMRSLRWHMGREA